MNEIIHIGFLDTSESSDHRECLRRLEEANRKLHHSLDEKELLVKEIESLQAVNLRHAKTQEYSQSIINELKENLASTQQAYEQIKSKLENFNFTYERQLENFEKTQVENEIMHQKLATVSERESNKYRSLLNKEKKNFEDILSSYESRLDIKTNKYNELQKRLETLCRQLEELRASDTKMREENRRLIQENKSQNEKVEAAVATLVEKESDYRKQLEEMAIKIKTLQEINDAFETTVRVTSKEFENREEEAEIEYKKEENELEKLKVTFEEYKAQKYKETDAIVQENQNLISELYKLRSSESEMRAEVDNYKSQLQQTALKIQTLTEAQTSLETVATSHLKKIQDSESRWKIIKHENVLIAQELETLRKQFNDESSRANHLQNVVNKLNEECHSLHRKLGEISEAKLELDAKVRPELENFYIHKLKQEMHQNEVEKNRQIELFKHEIQLVQNENSQLHDRIREGPTRDVFEKKRDRVKALKALLAISDRTISDLQSEVNELTGSKKSLEWELKQLHESRQNLITQLESFKKPEVQQENREKEGGHTFSTKFPSDIKRQ